MLEWKRELVINFHKDQMMMINTNQSIIFTQHKHNRDAFFL